MEMQPTTSGKQSHLLVIAGVCVSGIASGRLGNNASGRDERVREGGLAVVDVGNYGHGPDVGHLVLDDLELRDGKVHHFVLAVMKTGKPALIP
jgi:hypothetical protein